jgi:hypothetical protein
MSRLQLVSQWGTWLEDVEFVWVSMIGAGRPLGSKCNSVHILSSEPLPLSALGSGNACLTGVSKQREVLPRG